MPIARQPFLNKALKFRARLEGEYEIAHDGVLLKETEGACLIMAGETMHVVLDCDITLLKDSYAFVQYNPELYAKGTLTGPQILTDTENRVGIRIEADEDIDLSELDYVAKILFESIY